MTKNEKIRKYMNIARCGDVYASGNIAREKKYTYRLFPEGVFSINPEIGRCSNVLLDKGIPQWERWANCGEIIRALESKYCLADLKNQFCNCFNPENNLSLWGFGVEDPNYPNIKEVR